MRSANDFIPGIERSGAVSTAEFIVFHASERPNATALITGGREITYADFERDLGRMAQALAALGVAPGQVVVVDADDVYLHFLLLIALEAMGAASASFPPQASEAYHPLLSRADLVLSEPGCAIVGTRRHHTMTAEWLQTVWALPSGDRRAVAPIAAEAPVRLARTSGTTGAMKTLVLPRRQHENRLQRYAEAHQFTENSRYLLTMPLAAFPVYGPAIACLRSGGTLVFEPITRMTSVQALSAHGITDVSLMPLHLKHMLDSLPADFPKPPRLTVYIFGAPISAAFRQQALARLATVVHGSYGCNEAGFISIAGAGDDDGTGTVWPGVQVEVVDDDDVPVPNGEIGRIRVRNEFMVEGYLDDPEATRRMFRDGWFYPGDSGILEDARRLRVLGRSDELLNVGGVKYSPDNLENLIARDAHVRDVAVCSRQNATGLEEVCVFVVTDGIGDHDLPARVLGALHRFQLGRVHILKLDAIPRTGAGKIHRSRLRSLAKAAVQG